MLKNKRVIKPVDQNLLAQKKANSINSFKKFRELNGMGNYKIQNMMKNMQHEMKYLSGKAKCPNYILNPNS